MARTAAPRRRATRFVACPIGVLVAAAAAVIFVGACHRQAATGAAPDAVAASKQDKHADTPDAHRCRGLDEAACEKGPGCQVVKGAAASHVPAYAGCFTAVVNGDPRLCAEALTCAKAPTPDGRCLLFSSSCIPDDWTAVPACDQPGCPTPGTDVVR